MHSSLANPQGLDAIADNYVPHGLDPRLFTGCFPERTVGVRSTPSEALSRVLRIWFGPVRYVWGSNAGTRGPGATCRVKSEQSKVENPKGIYVARRALSPRDRLRAGILLGFLCSMS